MKAHVVPIGRAWAHASLSGTMGAVPPFPQTIWLSVLSGLNAAKRAGHNRVNHHRLDAMS